MAALTPSNPPLATKMDVKEFHKIYGHASESLLRATAKRLGVELYPMIVRDDCIRRTWMHFLASVGGKEYPMIVRDDYIRRKWMCFLKHKSDAASVFRSYLASVRADGKP